jgi:glyoxylase-like metal-dependent hydrolase (beta-lactamase superfamily II)
MISAKEFHKVTSTLYHWGIYDSKVKCDLTSHAWQSTEGLIFFDPVPLAAQALEELIEGRQVYAILLTNSNHARCADWYRKQFSIPIIAPKSATRDLEITPDHSLDDFSIPASIHSISLDGAAPGETAYYIEQEGILIVGDAIIHLPPLGLAYLPDKYCTDSRKLRTSAQSLLRISPEYICFAHGAPIVYQAKIRLLSLLSTG